MPVILKTQKAFIKFSPLSHFTFQHELPMTPETKAPKFQVKYNLVKRDSQSEPVASVFEPTNYVPLVQRPEIDFVANQRAIAQAGQAAYERALLQQAMADQINMEPEVQVKMEPEPQVKMEPEPQVKMEPEVQVNVKKRKGSTLQSTRKGKAPVQGMFVPPEIYFPPKKRKGSILESTSKGKAPVQGLFVPPYNIGRPVDYLARPGLYLEQRPPKYEAPINETSAPEYEPAAEPSVQRVLRRSPRSVQKVLRNPLGIN